MSQINSILLFLIFIVSGCFKDKIVQKEYWENGELKSSISYNLDSLKNGVESYWYSNGIKEKESIYVNGVESDYQKEWYQTGILKSSFSEIKIDTIEREDTIYNEIHLIQVRSKKGFEYYLSGKKKIYKEVYKGERYGKWMFWNEVGELIREEFYENGTIKSVNEY